MGITLLRVLVINRQGRVIAASQAGKYKTLFECIGLGMLMVPLSPVWPWYLVTTRVVILVALALCLYSGAEYVIGMRR